MIRPKWGLLTALAVGIVASANVFAIQDAKPSETDEKKPALAEIDKPVKDFALKDLAKKLKEGEKEDARIVKISQFKDKKPVLLFFMNENCGTTWRYEKRVGDLLAKYGKKDVAFLGVRCTQGSTEEGILKFADARNFDMPILNDDKGEMTRYFKATATPTFVLIDKKGVYRYFGAFDDSANEAQVENKYIPDAVTAILASKDVAVKRTRAFG